MACPTHVSDQEARFLRSDVPRSAICYVLKELRLEAFKHRWQHMVCPTHVQTKELDFCVRMCIVLPSMRDRPKFQFHHHVLDDTAQVNRRRGVG